MWKISTQGSISVDYFCCLMKSTSFHSALPLFQSAMEAVRASANELIKTCDLDIAKTVEQRLAAVEKKFSDVQSRGKQRDQDLREVDQGLREFKDKLEDCTNWVQGGIQKLDSKDLAKLPSEDMTEQLEQLASEKKRQEKKVTDLKAVAEQLINDPRTGEYEDLEFLSERIVKV